ncbi:MAG: hypothetical protein AAGA66_00995 [Bacteroidota bacterium]
MEKDTLIEKFLSQQLSSSELETFREKWANDPDFVQEVRDYTELIISVKAAEQVTKGKLSKGVGIHSTRRLYYRIAAVILLLIVTIPCYWVVTSTSSKKIARENFIDLRLQTSRDVASDDTSPLNEALRLHGQNQPLAAIDVLRKTVKNDESTPIKLFILGDLFMTTGQGDSAIYYYQKGRLLIENDPYTHWNTIMAMLLNRESGNAKVLLAQLADSDQTPYNEKARKILNEIKTPGFRLKVWLGID